MHTRRIFLTILALMGLWGAFCRSTPGYAQEPLHLNATRDQYPLGRFLTILEDPAKRFSIDDVRSPDIARQFVPNTRAVPNFGYTDSAYWVRVQVNNQASARWWLVMAFPNMNVIDLYVPDFPCDDPATCEMTVIHSGNLRPFKERLIPYHHFVFPLTLPPHTPVTLYLRFENKAAMTLPLSIWNVEAFAHYSQAKQFRLGIFYGILAIMAGYNLFLAFSLKNRDHLYYVLFLAAYILYQFSFDGLASQYLWPGYAGLNRYIVTMGAGLTAFAVLGFSDHFLRLNQVAPRLHRLVQVFQWAAFGLCLLAPFVNIAVVIKILTGMALAGVVAILAGASLSWARGHRAAKFFLLAWSIFLGAMTLQVLSRSGVLPSTPITEYGDRVGAVLLMLLLSLALANQIRDIYAENDRAQAEALRLKDELTAALQRAKAELERRVAAQNDELQQANAEITLLNQVMQSAAQLGEASIGLTDISGHIADDAEYIAKHVESVSSKSQQTNTLIHDISEATDQAAAAMQNMADTVTQVTEKIALAHASATASNATIADLQSHSREIDNIIKIITNIAQQTNLLALNATIEAARAGDVGRGFTVVASEVKDLARETSTSADDITQKIETMQGSSRRVTSTITDVVGAIENVADLARAIATTINQQTTAATNISQSLGQAAEDSRDISQTMETLAVSARDASQRAGTIQLEAQKLFALAEHLQTLVESARQSQD